VLEFYYHEEMTRWSDSSNAEFEVELRRMENLPENYRKIKFGDIVLDGAYTIASAEEFSEVEGEDFHETEFDVHMVANIFEYHGERFRDFIYDMAEEYGIDNYKYKELQSMPIEENNQFFLQLEQEAIRKAIQEVQNEKRRKVKS